MLDQLERDNLPESQIRGLEIPTGPGQTSLEEARAKFGEQHGHLFLLADGMGGHHAGEHASALAVTLIEQFALNTFRWFMPLSAAHSDSAVTDFQEAVEQADATIVEAATKRADLHGMGTTLTLAFHYEAELLVIHVGDSRAYLFRDETLRQLTRDHTVVAEMVRRGELDLAEARAQTSARHHQRRRWNRSRGAGRSSQS